MSDFLFDLKTPETTWKGKSQTWFEDGSLSADVGSVLPPEGPHMNFWVLDTVMYKNPPSFDPNKTYMPHFHLKGYETFFVDSGKVWIFINGQKALAQKGDIVQLQAGQAHGMYWLEDVKWRGTYHDLIVPPAVRETMLVQKYMPELEKDEEFKALNPGMDKQQFEPFLCSEVPTEQCLAIKNPSRPHAEYRIDGCTAKIIVERWENGGFNELALFEMEPGFHVEFDKYPNLHELYYVRKGKVKFTICGEEVIADDECVVNVPRFAPHSVEAIERSDVYDLGGLTMWSMMFQYCQAIRHYEPERLEKPETIEAIKKKFSCDVKSFGLKK